MFSFFNFPWLMYCMVYVYRTPVVCLCDVIKMNDKVGMMCHLTVCLSTLGFPSFCIFLFAIFFQKVQAVFQSCINTTLSFNPQQEKCAQALLPEAYLYWCNRRPQPCKQKCILLILLRVGLFQLTGLLTGGRCVGVCKIRA